MTILFGINNCDTVRKARKWLDANQAEYSYHDLRLDGITQATIESWLNSVPASTLINRRSTTWKQLNTRLREQLASSEVDTMQSPAQLSAIATLIEQPTLIKRPVLQRSDRSVLVGFSESSYQSCI